MKTQGMPSIYGLGNQFHYITIVQYLPSSTDQGICAAKGLDRRGSTAQRRVGRILYQMGSIYPNITDNFLAISRRVELCSDII